MSPARKNCPHAHVLRTCASKMVLSEEYCDNILAYLWHGTYPKDFSKNDRRSLRRRAAVFQQKNGVLYYPGSGNGQWRRVIRTVEERKRILDASDEGNMIRAVLADGFCQDPSVNVYDSMFHKCSPHIQQQIACILATKYPHIKANFFNVNHQSGSNDCGLFAVAFAVSLCHGLQPSKFCFEQPKMRCHLIQCLEKGKNGTFPC